MTDAHPDTTAAVGAGQILQADDVHKSFTVEHQRLHILRGASLQVSQGECVAIVGPSGAGKSTLLHILGGLDAPDRGRVYFDQQDVYAVSGGRRAEMRNRGIGFVFQFYHLLPELDVLENVTLPAMAGRPPTDIRERAMSLLDAIGLRERANHTPLELSGGEQQRVAVARALMNDPALILADEPTGNLDNETGRQVIECLFKLTRHEQRTLVLVTHDTQLASECDRALHLEDGVLA